MYPAFLQGMIYKGSINGPAEQTVRSYLSGQEPGTCAFFEFTRAATETSGMPGARPTPITWERAMGLSGGNPEFAKIMMVQADDSKVGFMYVTPEKKLRAVRLNCEQVSLQFTSLAALLTDMQRNGYQADPKKLQFPGMMYMVQDFGDDD